MLELEWMQSPPVRFALRDFGYPSNDDLVDFFEQVLKNTDTIGDALSRMEDKPLKKIGAAGFRGVAKTRSKSSPWRATIVVNGKQLYLGTYATIEDAIEARLEAEARYN